MSSELKGSADTCWWLPVPSVDEFGREPEVDDQGEFGERGLVLRLVLSRNEP